MRETLQSNKIIIEISLERVLLAFEEETVGLDTLVERERRAESPSEIKTYFIRLSLFKRGAFNVI